MATAQTRMTASHSADGFPDDQIIDVFNRIPFIQAKEGFMVEEKYSVAPNKVSGSKVGHIDFSFEEKFSYAPLYQMSITTNDFYFMAKKPFLDYETNHYHFPQFYTDTLTLSWFNRNGVLVGEGVDPLHRGASDSFFVLNPKGKPFFKTVSQEEYIHFLLAIMQGKIDEKQKHLDEYAVRNGAPPPGIDPSNTKVMAMIAQNLKADSLWIDYYHRRIKEYTALLAYMTEGEKKQRAYAITPKLVAIEHDKQNHLKESIQGGMPFELLTKKEDAAAIFPLYEFNSAFFDPKLSAGAVQLMVFWDINGSGLKDFAQKIKEQFFPQINFKAFANIMY